MFFSIITKKLNWENLTKNEEDGIGLRMKNFNIMGVHWKIRCLGEFIKNQSIYRGEYPKKWGLGQLAELRGKAWPKRGVWCFWGGEGVDTPMYTMSKPATLLVRFLRGCFSHFLNCGNGTKSRKPPVINPEPFAWVWYYIRPSKNTKIVMKWRHHISRRSLKLRIIINKSNSPYMLK